MVEPIFLTAIKPGLMLIKFWLQQHYFLKLWLLWLHDEVVSVLLFVWHVSLLLLVLVIMLTGVHSSLELHIKVHSITAIIRIIFTAYHPDLLLIKDQLVW